MSIKVLTALKWVRLTVPVKWLSTICLVLVAVAPYASSAGVLGGTVSSVGKKGGVFLLERKRIVKPAPQWRNSELRRLQVQRELREIDSEVVQKIRSRYGRYVGSRVYAGRSPISRLGDLPENVRISIARERIKALANRNLNLIWGEPLLSEVGNYFAARAIGRTARSPKEKIFQRIENKLGDGSLEKAYFNGDLGSLASSFDRHFGRNSYLSFIELMKSGSISKAKRIIGLISD